jgi:hypothetical protein
MHCHSKLFITRRYSKLFITRRYYKMQSLPFREPFCDFFLCSRTAFFNAFFNAFFAAREQFWILCEPFWTNMPDAAENMPLPDAAEDKPVDALDAAEDSGGQALDAFAAAEAGVMSSSSDEDEADPPPNPSKKRKRELDKALLLQDAMRQVSSSKLKYS